MLNEIKSLRNNLTAENLNDTFDAYERLNKRAPRILITIGKKDANASAIRAGLNDLLRAMRDLNAKIENEYYSRFEADQYEG